MLEVRALEKRYPGGDAALRGVSFTIEGSDAVFVIGPSGAGKSTLLRCLNRLVEPDRGSVRLDGREITTLDTPALRLARRDMGMIFQEFNLVERLTVMENVLSGRLGYVSFWRAWRRRFPPDDVRAAFAMLARVGLDEDLALSGCSLVSFSLPGTIRGAVGVLGPLRMDYARVLAVVDAVGSRVTDLLRG